MQRRVLGVLISAVACSCLAFSTTWAAGNDGPLLAATWIDETFKRVRFTKVLIIGITDQQETRRRFEDKFVSHVRSKGLGSVRSASLAGDLSRPEARETIIQGIEDESVDCAITIRAVGMKKKGEEAWVAAWKASTEERGTVSQLVQNSLPVGDKRAPYYGLEVALWDAKDGAMIWAARSEQMNNKQLNKYNSAFLEAVLRRLQDNRLLDSVSSGHDSLNAPQP